jgi:DNA-binding NtrC family response regulator
VYTLLIARGSEGAPIKGWLEELDHFGPVVEVDLDHIAAMFVRGSDPPVLIVRIGAAGLGESALLGVPIEAGIELPPTIVLSDGEGARAVRELNEPSLHPLDIGIDEAGFLRFLDRLFAADDSSIGLRIDAHAAPPTLHLDHHIGDSPAMMRVYSMLRTAGPKRAPVLITGESGTGKELVARALHDLSKRRGPLEAVNCGAIPDNLIEAYLFGYQRGAFTGAVKDTKGVFETSHTGTIFLDEIGEMPMNLQVRLLRVLELGVIRRIGDTRDRQIDVRVLAATHVDLEVARAEKRFREDLYHRLAVLKVALPPLRERGEDLAQLILHLGRIIIDQQETRPVSLSKGALRAMERYHWPGNVRELNNVLTQLMVFAESELIRVEDLPPEIRGLADPHDSDALVASDVFVLPEEGIDLEALLRRLQKSLIEQARDRAGGNKARAAALLQLNRTTLIDRIRRLGVDWPK